MSGLLGAVGLLTRVPVRGRGDPARAAGWLPVVGAGIGAAVGGTYAGAANVLPPLPAAFVAVAVGVWLTGALHEDGLADCADALGARGDVLAVLRDPRLGAFGVLALVFSVGLRVAALAGLGPLDAVLASVAAHALGRTAAVGVMLTGRPAADGVGAAHAAPRSAWVGVVVGASAAAALGVRAPLAIVVAAAAVVVTARWARRRIGGWTGDVLGAAEQLTEVAVLLVAVGSRP